jgi:hypothetical protein
MKKDTIIYWVATVATVLTGAIAAFGYFNTPMFIEGFHHLGFPDYFRIELAIGKIIGAAILLLPAVPRRFKEWAYVGFGIVFISAVVAHLTVDGIAKSVGPLIPLVFLIISYVYFHKLSNAEQHTA